MIAMNLENVLRDILGAHRVQCLYLSRGCSVQDASPLDYQFREQLFKAYDYTGFVGRIMDIVPEDNVIDYKDDFGLHYLVFREQETDRYAFFGPFVYRIYKEDDFAKLLEQHALTPNALESIHWYFKRVPVIKDVLSWRHMFETLLSRYLANPNLSIRTVRYDRVESAAEKPSIALTSIPYTSVEARYATENAMLDAIRRGDISEAIYQQNQFMGFTLDARQADPVRDAKNMVIAVNTIFRKTVEQAAVHPLYIDSLSRQYAIEIENAETEAQVDELIPKMIRAYCLLVQTYSRERYSEPVRFCLNHVDFHYMEPLSLETLARKSAVNKNYLSQRFHKEVGMTVTDYINVVRVRRSLKLLSQTSLSMQDIAERCGFADANYFTRTFRKIHGSTPNQYRKSTTQQQTKK